MFARRPLKRPAEVPKFGSEVIFSSNRFVSARLQIRTGGNPKMSRITVATCAVVFTLGLWGEPLGHRRYRSRFNSAAPMLR